MRLLMVLFLVLASCDQAAPPKKLSQNELDFIATFTLTEKIGYEHCIANMSTSFCIDMLISDRRRAGCPTPPANNGMGNGTAAVLGAAAGYGAAKLFSGKRRR